MAAWTASCWFSAYYFFVVREDVVPGLFPKTWSERTKAKDDMVVCSGVCGRLLFCGSPFTRLALLGSSIRSYST